MDLLVSCRFLRICSGVGLYCGTDAILLLFDSLGRLFVDGLYHLTDSRRCMTFDEVDVFFGSSSVTKKGD